MENYILDINNLSVEYNTDDTNVYAVNGVSLQIKKGESVGLVGETGAGKTTIAKSILRILPYPQSKLTTGTINFNGKNILEISEKEMQKIRGNKIAMIFQDPMTALNPVETVGFQIAETIKKHNAISRIKAREKACAMLEMVGIPMERYNEYPHQFSGGMKQRVVIAMALACNPELLLADEPTTALDVTIQAQVLDMMRTLRERMNTSVLLITHDFGVVADFCETVAVAYAGEIVEKGSVDSIFNNAKHPYTLGLFASLPSLEESASRLKPIKGLMPDPTKVMMGCAFAERCPYATDECTQRKPVVTEVEEGHFVKCIRAEVEANGTIA